MAHFDKIFMIFTVRCTPIPTPTTPLGHILTIPDPGHPLCYWTLHSKLLATSRVPFYAISEWEGTEHLTCSRQHVLTKCWSQIIALTVSRNLCKCLSFSFILWSVRFGSGWFAQVMFGLGGL